MTVRAKHRKGRISGDVALQVGVEEDELSGRFHALPIVIPLPYCT